MPKTSKRTVKKQIRYSCGDIAAECIIARNFVEGVDAEAMNAIVCRVADLQTEMLSHCTVAFDRTPRDFANRREYARALHAFRKAAFDNLRKEFNTRALEIVKDMNAAMPKK